MKVLDLGFNLGQLQKFDSDSFYTENQEALKEDFRRLTFEFLDIDLPDTITEEQKSTVRTQATDMFVMFVVGHLNFLDLESSVTKALHTLKKKAPTLWLPS